MDAWIDIVKWFVAAFGSVLVIGSLALAAMVWLLNHPD